MVASEEPGKHQIFLKCCQLFYRKLDGSCGFLICCQHQNINSHAYDILYLHSPNVDVLSFSVLQDKVRRACVRKTNGNSPDCAIVPEVGESPWLVSSPDPTLSHREARAGGARDYALASSFVVFCQLLSQIRDREKVGRPGIVIDLDS